MHSIIDSTEFDTNYPDKRAVSTINVESPLTSRARLVELAQTHPADLVEFNAGDLPISVSPDSIPDAGMSAAETIEKIGMVNSWMTIRNIEKDLGSLALPRIPVHPSPCTVVEYFPDGDVSGFTDPRQHAVSLVYVVPVEGICEPSQVTLDIAWLTPTEADSDEVRAEMTSGQDRLLRLALAHAGCLP